ncbi:MAG: hypothetical protein LBS74_01860 [Oscillospiraceae bacterium]|jgi:hypothetical protein|nr:hypothetical protein [Oscillospiraceae bacterium]
MKFDTKKLSLLLGAIFLIAAIVFGVIFITSLNKNQASSASELAKNTDRSKLWTNAELESLGGKKLDVIGQTDFELLDSGASLKEISSYRADENNPVTYYSPKNPQDNSYFLKVAASNQYLGKPLSDLKTEDLTAQAKDFKYAITHLFSSPLEATPSPDKAKFMLEYRYSYPSSTKLQNQANGKEVTVYSCRLTVLAVDLTTKQAIEVLNIINEPSDTLKISDEKLGDIMYLDSPSFSEGSESYQSLVAFLNSTADFSGFEGADANDSDAASE